MRVLLWGVASGAAAWICASGIVRDSAGAGWEVLPYGAGLAALLLGALARRLLAAGDRAPSGRRGAGLGALVVVLSYPLAWVLSILIGSLAGGRSSFADPALGASDAAWGSLVLGLGSLLLTGWLTVPLGAGLGALLARAERTLPAPSRGAPAAPAASPTPDRVKPGGPDPMALVLLLFGIGFALLLVGSFVYSPLYDMPAAFDWRLTIGLYLALLGIHALLLRARGGIDVELVAIGVFLLPTALALSVGGVMTLNGVLDTAAPTHHVARLVGAYRAKSSIGPDRPYPRLQVETWRPGEPDPWLDVDAELYDSVTPDRSAIGVVTKPGWLSIEWIVDIHAEPGADAAR